ncbi:hypothetical protein MMC25_008267, partial [Agyrium rufum]|nr:hypothetical protein [Agyrium rufum]
QARSELKEGATRPVSKEYYWINIHLALDAIKYRVFHLTKRVKDLYRPADEKKDFFCPRCKSRWTSLEVLDNISPFTHQFLCHKCDGVLERDQTSASDIAGHERQSKLMVQLEKLVGLLQQIDAHEVPNPDFDESLANSISISRNEEINPRANMSVIENGLRVQPMAVRGIVSSAATPLEVDLTTSSAHSAAEEAAAAKRKAETAQQNALPVWHTTSTVTRDTSTSTTKDAPGARSDGDKTMATTDRSGKGGADEDKNGDVLSDELAAYYAELQKEREREARQDMDFSDNGEDDEADEVFTDIAIPQSGSALYVSGFATPASSGVRGLSTESLPIIGREDSESGSSALKTATSTPAHGNVSEDQDESDRRRKKARMELPNELGLIKSDEEAEEDEEEFEDAL